MPKRICILHCYSSQLIVELAIILLSLVLLHRIMIATKQRDFCGAGRDPQKRFHVGCHNLVWSALAPAPFDLQDLLQETRKKVQGQRCFYLIWKKPSLYFKSCFDLFQILICTYMFSLSLVLLYIYFCVVMFNKTSLYRHIKGESSCYSYVSLLKSRPVEFYN